MKTVCVFCAAGVTNNPLYRASAVSVSNYFGQNGTDMVYGGSSSGLMGELADSALASGCNITGVLPTFLSQSEPPHRGLSKLIMVKSLSERQDTMYRLSDGIIALPGGFGTMVQLLEMVTWAQLGLHSKPIGILNVNGYYNGFLNLMKIMQQEGLLTTSSAKLIMHADRIEDLFQAMSDYKPAPTSLKMKEDQI